jgi:hypothetical protein
MANLAAIEKQHDLNRGTTAFLMKIVGAIRNDDHRGALSTPEEK